MKKGIITLAVTLALGMNLHAQNASYTNDSKNDAYFSSNFSEFRQGTSSSESWINEMPMLLGHAYETNQSADNAPLGSGLLLLAGLGITYGVRKKHNQ